MPSLLRSWVDPRTPPSSRGLPPPALLTVDPSSSFHLCLRGCHHVVVLRAQQGSLTTVTTKSCSFGVQCRNQCPKDGSFDWNDTGRQRTDELPEAPQAWHVTRVEATAL